MKLGIALTSQPLRDKDLTGIIPTLAFSPAVSCQKITARSIMLLAVFP